jgi:hypothetical protein
LDNNCRNFHSSYSKDCSYCRNSNHNCRHNCNNQPVIVWRSIQIHK